MNCYNKVKSNNFQQRKMESNFFQTETLRKIQFSKCLTTVNLKIPVFFPPLKKMSNVQKLSEWKTELFIFRYVEYEESSVAE